VNKKLFFKRYWYIILLLVFGLFLFIPDPLDFIFGLGIFVEFVSLILGLILTMVKVYES